MKLKSTCNSNENPKKSSIIEKKNEKWKKPFEQTKKEKIETKMS